MTRGFSFLPVQRQFHWRNKLSCLFLHYNLLRNQMISSAIWDK